MMAKRPGVLLAQGSTESQPMLKSRGLGQRKEARNSRMGLRGNLNLMLGGPFSLAPEPKVPGKPGNNAWEKVDEENPQKLQQDEGNHPPVHIPSGDLGRGNALQIKDAFVCYLIWTLGM